MSHLVRIFLDVYISEDACSVFLAHSTSLTYASISKNLIYFASRPLICLFFLKYYYYSYKTFIASYIFSYRLLIYNSTRRFSFMSLTALSLLSFLTVMLQDGHIGMIEEHCNKINAKVQLHKIMVASI